MKSKISHFLLGAVLGLSLLAVSDIASAHCWMTKGYWSYGYWHAGHRVCNGYAHRCGWVHGYRGPHGRWHAGHRSC